MKCAESPDICERGAVGQREEKGKKGHEITERSPSRPARKKSARIVLAEAELHQARADQTIKRRTPTKKGRKFKKTHSYQRGRKLR